MISFTICSNNYLAEAITLGNSLKAQGTSPNDFKIFLVDKKNKAINYVDIPFEITVVTEEITPGFNRISTLYDIVELNTAVKASIFKYLIKLNEEEQYFSYLDPDLYFLQNIEKSIKQEIGTYSILLTPHILQPLDFNQQPFENTFLNFGIYNLGFIALKADSTGLKMLDWWEERLLKLGFNDVINGLYVDQLWINLVPIFFENVKVSKHPGFNTAYWNLSERTILIKENKFYINENYQLVFFHFSSFNFSLKSLSKRPYTTVEKSDLVLEKLVRIYKLELENNGYLFYRNFTPYYAVTFENHINRFLPNPKHNNKIKYINKVIQLIPKYILDKVINFAHIASILLKYKS